jgi:histidyl-tRNA synthetase
MQLLPGFRDFYPEDCARRNYILATWREVARRYGFVEYDGPVLEPTELYQKKSGDEIVKQLFNFTDKGAREVAMRPEMTPTLARMVIARERDFKKPLKWFSIAQFFRYEKQQRGRLREFYQFNADIIGEASIAADAELIAVAIDLLRALGFSELDFVVRVSNRDAWGSFLEEKGVPLSRAQEFLDVIDKIDRADESHTRERLKAFGVELESVLEYIAHPEKSFSQLQLLKTELESRGRHAFVEFDLKIVRGLAYYTGFVFEVFDRERKSRALAGGGRYDHLLAAMSNGKVDLPATGFGMGDVVLGNLIADTPQAQATMDAWVAHQHAADLYVVIAKEERRADALTVVQQLRDLGMRVDFPFVEMKVGKQFQTAEQLGAILAVLVGDEWPHLKIKTLASREETLVPREELAHSISNLVARRSAPSSR